MNIPKTVREWIKPHMSPMIERAKSNSSGVCKYKSENRLAIYAHTSAVPESCVPPGSKVGQNMVYVEWTAMAGYSDDPMSFGAALLTPRDDVRVCSVAMTFEEALAL